MVTSTASSAGLTMRSAEPRELPLVVGVVRPNPHRRPLGQQRRHVVLQLAAPAERHPAAAGAQPPAGPQTAHEHAVQPVAAATVVQRPGPLEQVAVHLDAGAVDEHRRIAPRRNLVRHARRRDAPTRAPRPTARAPPRARGAPAIRPPAATPAPPSSPAGHAPPRRPGLRPDHRDRVGKQVEKAEFQGGPGEDGAASEAGQRQVGEVNVGGQRPDLALLQNGHSRGELQRTAISSRTPCDLGVSDDRLTRLSGNQGLWSGRSPERGGLPCLDGHSAFCRQAQVGDRQATRSRPHFSRNSAIGSNRDSLRESPMPALLVCK